MSKIDYQKLDLMDALDLAVFIEEEAKERYEQFADQVGTRYEGDAGSVFSIMVKNEQNHKNQLQLKRRKLFGDTPIRVTRDMIWDVEAPDMGRPRIYMSPYEAMEVALEGEVKAYEFFDEALKSVKDSQVRALFEDLRDEELEHQTMLKNWMKKHEDEKKPDRSDDDIDDPPAL